MKTALYCLILSLFVSCVNTSESYRFYVLSSDENEENPIQLYAFDAGQSELKQVAAFSGVKGGNYLAISPDQKHLLATSHTSDKAGAGLVSYSIGEGGVLFKVGEMFSWEKGALACHVSFSGDQKQVYTANYSSGEAHVWGFDDQTLKPIKQSFVFEGSGPDESRQKGPHAHFMSEDPSGKYVYTVDLGTDKVMCFVKEDGELKPNPDQAFLLLHPGAGPRHLAFHPSGEQVYVLNELESSITSCALDTENGTLKPLNKVKMLPASFDGFSKAAAIRIHPSGKFVYASNRGFHSVSVYGISPDGSFELIEHEQEGINWPRDFQLTPDGKYLFCCNMKTNNFSVYKIETNGALTYTGIKSTISSPLCLNFLK